MRPTDRTGHRQLAPAFIACWLGAGSTIGFAAEIPVPGHPEDQYQPTLSSGINLSFLQPTECNGEARRVRRQQLRVWIGTRDEPKEKSEQPCTPTEKGRTKVRGHSNNPMGARFYPPLQILFLQPHPQPGMREGPSEHRRAPVRSPRASYGHACGGRSNNPGIVVAPPRTFPHTSRQSKARSSTPLGTGGSAVAHYIQCCQRVLHLL